MSALGFNPDDGTAVGRALGTLNALLSRPLAPVTTIRVWFGPAPADLDLADAEGNPVDVSEIVVMEGEASVAVLARSLADALIVDHRGATAASGGAL